MNVVEEVGIEVVHGRAGMGYQIIVDLHNLVKGVILKDAVQEVVEKQSIFAGMQVVIESPGHPGVILDTGNLYSWIILIYLKGFMSVCVVLPFGTKC